MKRNLDELNLRQAFRSMPDGCYLALINAARSVKEEDAMKRASFRVVLIAAALIVATMAAALAVSEVFGWTDFFGKHFQDVGVPKAAEEILSGTEEKAYTVGPLTFKVRQLFADGRIAMASTQIVTADGSKALLCMDAGDAVGVNGENGETLAKALGVSPDTSWQDAAKQLKLPLYSVRAVLEVAEEQMGGEAMEDVLYDPEGNLVYFSMPVLNPAAAGDTLKANMFLRVASIDPETGEEKEKQIKREAISLPVTGVLEQAEYKKTADYAANGLQLDTVQAERTPAGLYLTASFTAMKGLTQDGLMNAQPCPRLFDEQGKEYADGMDLSMKINTDEWPRVHLMRLVSADALPDRLYLAVTCDNTEKQDENALPKAELIRKK